MNLTIEQVTNATLSASLTRWWDKAQAAVERGGEDADYARRAMSVHRHPNTVMGFLSKERAWEVIQQAKVNQDLLIAGVGLSMIDDKRVFFLTDDMQFGYGVLPETFMRGSFPLPLGTRYREFDTIDEFIDAFATGFDNKPLRYIASLEELVAYVNESYP